MKAPHASHTPALTHPEPVTLLSLVSEISMVSPSRTIRPHHTLPFALIHAPIFTESWSSGVANEAPTHIAFAPFPIFAQTPAPV